MAITEPGCGSDSAAITTTAVRDGDQWVLNGTKIFCTSGQRALEKSEGFVVVWATVDKSAGRAGIKAFVVEARHARRDRHQGRGQARHPRLRHRRDRLRGLPHPARQPARQRRGEDAATEGFKGVMATFDATRPAVAASAIGIGRAAVDFVREALAKAGVEIRYDAPMHKLTALERDFMDMESNLQAARLLTWRAAWMMDRGMHNNLEASMCKAKAGLAVTQVTQKAVELLGPLGYSRKLLLEKWMRDAKINDIFEGTQQINLMIVARRILGYSSKELN